MANPSHSAFDSRRRLIIALLVVTILAAVLMVTAAVLLWKNGGDDGVVLKDNVVIYEEGSSPFTILASDADSVTVSSLDGLSADSVLAAGVTETTPYGLLRKAVSYEPVEGGYRIVTEQAALTDAIAECDVTVTIVVDDEGNYVVQQKSGRQEMRLIEQAFADEDENLLFSQQMGPLEVKGSQKLDISVQINWGKITFRLVDTVGLEAALTDASLEKVRLFERIMRPIVFSIGPVPVVIVPSISVEASFDGSLTGFGLSVETQSGLEGEAAVSLDEDESDGWAMEMSAKLEKSIGFEYSTDEGFSPVNEDRSAMPRLQFNPLDDSFGASIGGEVDASLKFLLYDCAGIEGSAGIAAEMGASLQRLSPDEEAGGAIELPGLSGKYGGDYDFKVYLPLKLSLVAENDSVANLFDGTHMEAGLEMTLIDSGDTITIIDDHRSFRGGTFAAAPRYATCEELSEAVGGIYQQMWEGYGVPSALVATRTASLELFPPEALDIMMDAAEVESIEALGALLSGLSVEDGVSSEDAAALEGFTLLFDAYPGDDCSEEDLASLNEELHEYGFSGTATAMKEIDVQITAKPTTAETAGQEQTQTIDKISAMEVDGGWYPSPEAQLADVVEGARAVAATELKTFTTGRRDGAPRLTFEYPAEWKSNSSVYGADEPSPLGCCSEIAWASGGPVDASVCLYYFEDELLLADEQATVVKIRDASFDPSAVGSQGTTDGGPYMVAELVFKDEEGDIASTLVLLPSSFVGEHPLSYKQGGFNMPFRCAGQTVDFSASGSATTFEDRQMVSRILGSMTVAS